MSHCPCLCRNGLDSVFRREARATKHRGPASNALWPNVKAVSTSREVCKEGPVQCSAQASKVKSFSIAVATPVVRKES